MGLSGRAGSVSTRLRPQSSGSLWLSCMASVPSEVFAGISHSSLGDWNTFPHHLLPGTLDPSRSGHHPSLA